MELKSWKGSGYKELARSTRARECHASERPFSKIAVDVRSRAFRYVRLNCSERKLWRKISCVFSIILRGIDAEVKSTFDDALESMKGEVEMMCAKGAVYVFCSGTPCPYKEPLRSYRAKEKAEAREGLDRLLASYKKNVLDVREIVKCHTAFQRYLMTHIEEVCLTYYHSSGISGSELLPELCVVPGEEDGFEPDRLCATMGADAILSEDLDCVALFGAKIMVREVSMNTMSYVALSDVIEKFESHTREDVVYRCCIMGTDYNLGIKGVGPVKARKIDLFSLKDNAELCLSSQSIDVEKFIHFLLVGH